MTIRKRNVKTGKCSQCGDIEFICPRNRLCNKCILGNSVKEAEKQGYERGYNAACISDKSIIRQVNLARQEGADQKERDMLEHLDKSNFTKEELKFYIKSKQKHLKEVKQ